MQKIDFVMRASTQLFLWQMMAIAEEIFRPSFRHGGGSFEGWADRNGLLRQIQRLEAEAFLERQPGGKADRVYRLTPKGRLAALGGKDPEERWKRSWDGDWRLLMFDLPRSPRLPRQRLHRMLRECGLGCLQGSVWLSPDPLHDICKRLKGDRHPSSLLLFEGHAVGGEKPQEMVREAWDFVAIKQEWIHYAGRLKQGNRFLIQDNIDADDFRDWLADEHAAWKQVIELDPLLPKQLLPRGYPGCKIWKKRIAYWSRLGDRLKKIGFPIPHNNDSQSAN